MMRVLKYFLLKDNKGYALPIAVIALAFLGILLLSIATIAANNTRQAVAQEDNLKAHYLARSGIEIAYGALMTDEGDLFYDLDDGQSLASETIALQGGEVTVNVERDGDWVTISAVGELENGEGRSEIHLDIDVNNPETTRWRGRGL